MALSGSVTQIVAVPAPELFALVTDIERLPAWNQLIQGVVERPETLARDAEWVVQLRAMGNTWHSRSRVLEHDHGVGRFVYQSQTDDGNPSYAIWTWTVDDDRAGAKVTVSWELHPETLVRRVLMAPIRNHQLRREVRASIQAAERAALAAR
jgi:ribosome-associated toxin RatA of RatAB toxin-antitoxin module